MSSIKVTLRTGEVKEFKHQGRAGGSYTKTVKAEGAFLVITDEWYNKTYIPESLIQEVKVDENNR